MLQTNEWRPWRQQDVMWYSKLKKKQQTSIGANKSLVECWATYFPYPPSVSILQADFERRPERQYSTMRVSLAGFEKPYWVMNSLSVSWKASLISLTATRIIAVSTAKCSQTTCVLFETARTLSMLIYAALYMFRDVRGQTWRITTTGGIYWYASRYLTYRDATSRRVWHRQKAGRCLLCWWTWCKLRSLPPGVH